MSGNLTDSSLGLPKAALGPLLDLRRQILQSGDLGTSATIDLLQSDQLERWRRGERIPAETYLSLWAEIPASASSPNGDEFCDLIYAELLLRRELGENPPHSEYFHRFPQYRTQLELVAELEDYVDSGLTADAEISTLSDRTDPAQSAALSRWPKVAGYEILGELGRGGMGIVYKARQTALQRLVALKMIRTGDEADAAALARFRVEAEAVAELQHPNIVQIYEIGGLDYTQGSYPFMTLELVSGGSLGAALANGQWPVASKEGQKKAAELVATIARAVHFAHQHGILHRDLKPGNILLQESGVRNQESSPKPRAPTDSCLLTPDSWTPKITDFGLAKRLEEGPGANTRTGSMLGTPSYMAPEQAAGLNREIGVATDVYALGAILYELLTGKPPFKGETPLETMLQVRTAEPVPPRHLRPNLPVDLETICLKCLAKDSQKRYASAQHLVDDLQRFLAREPILARPVSRLERCLKWARRRPAASSLICVSAVAALTVLVVVLISNSRLEHQRDETEQRREEAEEQRLLAVSHLGKARMAVDRMLTRVAQDRLKYIPQMDPVRVQLLADALELYQELARDAGADLELRSEIAGAFFRLGDLSSWMGQPAKADYCFKEAIAIQRQLYTKYPAERRYREALGKSYRALSGIQILAKQLKEAEQNLERAFEIQGELCREFPDEADYLSDMAKSYNTQGNLISAQKSPKESERSYGIAIRHYEELVSRFPLRSVYVLALLTSRNNLALSMAEDRRLSEAEVQYRLNLKVCEDALKREPANMEYESKLALTCGNLGATLADLGRYSEAMAIWNRCVEVDERLLADQRESPLRSYALADLLYDMGRAALKNGHQADARHLLERALPHSRTAVKLAPDRKEMVSLHCDSCAALAQTLLQLEEHKEAARMAVEPCSLCPDSAAELVRAAGVLAQCVPLAEQDPHSAPEQRRETGRQYGDQAISLLKEAVVKAYRDIDFLQHDRSVDALRKRADFQQILLDLQKGAK